MKTESAKIKYGNTSPYMAYKERIMNALRFIYVCIYGDTEIYIKSIRCMYVYKK